MVKFAAAEKLNISDPRVVMILKELDQSDPVSYVREEAASLLETSQNSSGFATGGYKTKPTEHGTAVWVYVGLGVCIFIIAASLWYAAYLKAVPGQTYAIWTGGFIVGVILILRGLFRR